jgi:HlyD family secretion protein
MKRKTFTFIFISVVGGLLASVAALWIPEVNSASAEQQPNPALTVTVVSPQQMTLPVRISANGNLMPWQEASIGAEAHGLRLIDVKVNVGDKVARGQVLAEFAANILEAELAQSRASVAEAEVALAEANANAQRALALQDKGALSAQQIQQSVNAERSAKARLDSARALENIQQLRLQQTQVHALDDGIISARTATVGAVVPAGEELFRMIRQGRIEWRAEVAAAELGKLRPGQKATVTTSGGIKIPGKLRMLAPAVDTQTRNGLVYVDLPPDENLKAGMFARGEFEIDTNTALTLPQTAVLLRDGYSYVLRIGRDSNVIQTKIKSGRRIGDRVEILEGLDESVQVVATGGGFLSDGDPVRVVDAVIPQSASTSFAEAL